jgi:aldehyde:ferredoxin oxidoreductase
MTVKTLDRPIEITPGVLGGKPRIAGRRIAVQTVVIWHERMGTGRAATGIDLEIAERERPIAERIVTLERCLDVRNTGRSRADDEAVIPHFQWAAKVDGTRLSASGDEFRAMLEDYYRLRGWDVETGHPTRETIQALGLGEVIEVL